MSTLATGRNTYREIVRCTFCKREFLVRRRRSSEGMSVETHCPFCRKHFESIAGKVPT